VSEDRAQRSGNIRGINGLRAAAVLSVIAAHAHVFWLHGGVGVDVFFAISGFLITWLMLIEAKRFNRIDLVRFWGRRLLRLFPALLLMLLVINAVGLVFSRTSGSPWELGLSATPAILLYISNWLMVSANAPVLGVFAPLWSLSVEEQFYFVWPVVVIFALRTRRPRLILTWIASGAIVFAIINRFVVFDGSNMSRTFGTDFHIDMILAGVLLAIAVDAGALKQIRLASGVLAIPSAAFLVAVTIFVPEFGNDGDYSAETVYYTFGLPIVALSSVSVIGFLVTHQGSWFTRAMSIKPLEYTGKISYGMYLWHYPIGMMLRNEFNFDPNVDLLITLIATYCIAAMSWKFLESPLLRRYHDRLRPRTPRPSKMPVTEVA
jgi:peptidoglycan/LPS O-acetylase OafA/YrhL